MSITPKSGRWGKTRKEKKDRKEKSLPILPKASKRQELNPGDGEDISHSIDKQNALHASPA